MIAPADLDQTPFAALSAESAKRNQSIAEADEYFFVSMEGGFFCSIGPEIWIDMANGNEKRVHALGVRFGDWRVIYDFLLKDMGQTPIRETTR